MLQAVRITTDVSLEVPAQTITGLLVSFGTVRKHWPDCFILSPQDVTLSLIQMLLDGIGKVFHWYRHFISAHNNKHSQTVSSKIPQDL